MSFDESVKKAVSAPATIAVSSSSTRISMMSTVVLETEKAPVEACINIVPIVFEIQPAGTLSKMLSVEVCSKLEKGKNS